MASCSPRRRRSPTKSRQPAYRSPIGALRERLLQIVKLAHRLLCTGHRLGPHVACAGPRARCSIAPHAVKQRRQGHAAHVGFRRQAADMRLMMLSSPQHNPLLPGTF
jgi:hypothetical protein